MKSNVVTVLTFVYVILVVGTIGTNKAYANASFCLPEETMFTVLSLAFPDLNVVKTSQNIFVSYAVDATTTTVANRNPTQMMECAYYVLDQRGAGTPGSPLHDRWNVINVNCPAIVAKATSGNLAGECADFIKTYNPQLTYYDIGGRKMSLSETTTAGSLLGLANTVSGAVETEPLPTNLAYFWNDSIKNVPFAGTALAASSTSYANAPLVDVILEIWKITRNTAFGLLSIVMLVTGVMIMTRRKLSPQLVVTAQYALPRIALSVALIAFSYPIGAVLLSSMRYLTDIAVGIINGTTSSGGFSLGAGSLPDLLASIYSGILMAAGSTATIMIFTALVMIVVSVLYLVIYLRAVLIYMKLLISIVIAPISFALGAVPGNEAMAGNWFKHALSDVLSYVGMFAFLNIGFFIVLKVIDTPTSSFGAGAASVLALLLMPIIAIWIFIEALKIPGKVENMIMGEPKRPGGRK